MTHPSRHRRRSKLRSWYVWHRWLGVSAAVLVVILAVTGIALNHTEALQLDQRAVRSEALLGWYGIDTTASLVSYDLDTRHLTQADAHWYLDTTPLPGEHPPLRGAVALPGMFAAASVDAVWLLTERGELVERMGAGAGVPAGIRRLGIDADGRLVVEAAEGTYRSDEQLMQWQPAATAANVDWARPAELPPSLRDVIVEQHRGAGLSLERVLLDLHSGRLFGRLGVYVMDAAALVLLLLAGSGTWLWLRGLLRRRRH